MSNNHRQTVPAARSSLRERQSVMTVALRAAFERWLAHVDPRLIAGIERLLTTLPPVRRRQLQLYDELLHELDPAVHPYRQRQPALTRLPAQGRPHTQILQEMHELAELEQARWRDGFVSGAVYHGQAEHIAFLNQVYALHSQSNPLHADLWPSTIKYEAEVIAMTAQMLGAGRTYAAAGTDSTICGTVTSGGTESILLAVRTYRDYARTHRQIRHPELILPVTAHAAFEKAAQAFNIRLRRIPVGADLRADPEAARKALNRNTIALVGSAPSFPHGIIDPIAELSEIARSAGVGFHVDACLGGFVLPWAERLGYPVPAFDFRLPGVTSISVDTHKYGYAAKGSSVLLWRGLELRRFQYFTATEWPGGLYFSPTLAGSRPGALSAICWAALVSLGEQGYLEATQRILETASQIRSGIAAIPGLQVLGDPLWVIAFTSNSLDIYRILDALSKRGWNLNGLHRPAALHLAVTLPHTQPGVAERFLSDLRTAVAEVRAAPRARGGMAPVYGLAASLPLRGLISDMLKRYLDLIYKP